MCVLCIVCIVCIMHTHVHRPFLGHFSGPQKPPFYMKLLYDRTSGELFEDFINHALKSTIVDLQNKKLQKSKTAPVALTFNLCRALPCTLKPRGRHLIFFGTSNRQKKRPRRSVLGAKKGVYLCFLPAQERLSQNGYGLPARAKMATGARPRQSGQGQRRSQTGHGQRRTRRGYGQRRVRLAVVGGRWILLIECVYPLVASLSFDKMN